VSIKKRPLVEEFGILSNLSAISASFNLLVEFINHRLKHADHLVLVKPKLLLPESLMLKNISLIPLE
jgi:hypothetical protein